MHRLDDFFDLLVGKLCFCITIQGKASWRIKDRQWKTDAVCC